MNLLEPHTSASEKREGGS